jgi:Rieske Fe-S protein
MSDAPRETEAIADRRRLLKWTIRLGTTAFAVAFALPALALKTLTQETKKIAAGDRLVYATGNRSGTEINLNDIPVPGAVQAFPQGKEEDQDNLVELVRLSESADGVLAYSAICTHLGCTVLATLTEQEYIACPCHGSIFDPADGAKVVHGPAGRPLPSLPISVGTDGTITAAGSFSGPVGP